MTEAFDPSPRNEKWETHPDFKDAQSCVYRTWGDLSKHPVEYPAIIESNDEVKTTEKNLMMTQGEAQQLLGALSERGFIPIFSQNTIVYDKDPPASRSKERNRADAVWFFREETTKTPKLMFMIAPYMHSIRNEPSGYCVVFYDKKPKNVAYSDGWLGADDDCPGKDGKMMIGSHIHQLRVPQDDLLLYIDSVLTFLADRREENLLYRSDRTAYHRISRSMREQETIEVAEYEAAQKEAEDRKKVTETQSVSILGRLRRIFG
jgi:hypothetical protein